MNNNRNINISNNDESFLRAKRKVKQLKMFYTNLISYVFVNAILITINVLTFDGYWWFLWVTLFWGIGIIAQCMKIIRFNQFGKEWEERKIKEYMEKEQEN